MDEQTGELVEIPEVLQEVWEVILKLDEDGKDDLPRNDLEECAGSNRVRGKQTGTGRGAVGQKIVPMPDSRMGGG